MWDIFGLWEFSFGQTHPSWMQKCSSKNFQTWPPWQTTYKWRKDYSALWTDQWAWAVTWRIMHVEKHLAPASWHWKYLVNHIKLLTSEDACYNIYNIFIHLWWHPEWLCFQGFHTPIPCSICLVAGCAAGWGSLEWEDGHLEGKQAHSSPLHLCSGSKRHRRAETTGPRGKWCHWLRSPDPP